jgi:L-lysine 6-transaminase
MVRFDRILEIMEEEQLVDHAGEVGAYLQDRLHDLAEAVPAMTNVRGRGLMTAFTLPTPEYRDRVTQQTYEEGAIILGCGERSIRFRTPLTITEDEVDEGIDCLHRALQTVASEHGAHVGDGAA